MSTTTDKMLINATQTEEIRVALVKNDRLYDLDIECPSVTKQKGDIRLGTVTRREPSLDAVFVEYGSKRQGFLPLKEISPEYFNPNAKDKENPSITDLIKEGQELLIQIDKEERGNKGAALTTFITLAGCYLVLMPNSPRAGGISRRIEGTDRDDLKKTLSSLELDEDMGVIIRTAGVGKKQEELQMDLDMLRTQWKSIKAASKNESAPCLIHKEGDVIIRSIRDNLRKSISEIIIDDQVTYVKAKRYIEQIKPEFLPHIKLYNSSVPLFTLHQIESQIETAYQREVALPSGGALVIDRTEALVSIDINSAKSTNAAGIELTAVNTNLEAADEIARQLRLRDLGGLVVIDFIDMSNNENQRKVEARLKEALKSDRARIQVGRISRFGLLEMSRQRLRLSLGETVQGVCPRCEGRGIVRNIQSHSLSIMRLIEEEALKDKIVSIQIQLPVDMAAYIINEKRDAVISTEKRHNVSITVIANPYFQMPQYKITTLNETQVGKNKKPSYSMIEQPDISCPTSSITELTIEPAVKPCADLYREQQKETGFFSRLWRMLGQTTSADKQTEAEDIKAPKSQETQNANGEKPHARRTNHPTNRRRRPQNNRPQQQQQQQQSSQQVKAKPQQPTQPSAKQQQTSSQPILTSQEVPQSNQNRPFPQRRRAPSANTRQPNKNNTNQAQGNVTPQSKSEPSTVKHQSSQND